MILSRAAAVVVALLHFGFLALEMFFWTKPEGMRIFKLAPDFANATRALAANQGLYNGFLAAGLLWGAFHPDASVGVQLRFFFAGCVIVAGTFGAATASPRILIVQALPGAIALALNFTSL